MRGKIKEIPGEEPSNESKCQHHWVIEGARGQTSRGFCKFCGTEKEFYNSWLSYTSVLKNTSGSEISGSPDIESDEEHDSQELEEVGANL